MSADEKDETMAQRKGRGLPWHSPPHLDYEGFLTFIITAACYEHQHIIGKDTNRLAECEQELLTVCNEFGSKIFAWCVLPNHYHLLVRTEKIKELRKEIGYFHGRSSRAWNLEDVQIGRKVWFNFFERDMKSKRHFWASLNYVHNNAVHHGYVNKWQDWPFSSASRFLDEYGSETALKIWNEFPVLDYGKSWDTY